MISPLNYVIRYLHRFSKELVILIPLLLVVLLTVNLLTPQTNFEKAKTALFNNPREPKETIALAKLLLRENNLSSAEIELENVPHNPEARKLRKLIANQKTSPQKIQSEIKFWQLQIAKFPNSRDAYLKLAVLNWRLYRNFEAKKYLSKALAIDPNLAFVLPLLEEQ